MFMNKIEAVLIVIHFVFIVMFFYLSVDPCKIREVTLIKIFFLIWVTFYFLGDKQSYKMNIETETDQTIVLLIRRRDPATLTKIYKEVYPMVLKHVLQNSGSKEDAQDIFQDAFYLLIKKTQEENFELTSQLSTFLVGISKNLWLKKITQTKLDADRYLVDQSDETSEETEEDIQQLTLVRRMNFALTQLGEPCKSILIQFYHMRQTMQEIAAMFHYTNPENAKNQKYKCLQRLKKLVEKNNG